MSSSSEVSSPISAQNVGLDALLVAIGALVLHLGIVLLWPIGKFGKYTLAAELRLADQLPTERLVDFSPLYLELCTLVRRLFGSSDLWLSALHHAMASTAVGIFYLLLRHRFGRPLAFFGAALLALDRRLLIYGPIFEPEAPMLLLVLAFTLAVVGLPAEGNKSRTHRAGPTWVAGLLAALAIATRPTFLPLFLLVPAFSWLDHFRARRASSSGPSARRVLVSSLLFLAPILLMMALLGWRAALATGSAGAPVMNPGTVFFEGNHPVSMGTSAIYPPSVFALAQQDRTAPDSAHEHYRTVARADDDRGIGGKTPEVAGILDIAGVNSSWSARARAYLSDHPREALKRILLKLRYSVHGFAWHDLAAARAYDLYLPMPTLSFALLAALALAGMAIESSHIRGRPQLDRLALLFYGFAAVQWVAILVFYVSSRQRLGLVPAFLFFALVAVESLLRKKRRSLVLGLAVILGMAGSIPDDAMLDEHYRNRREMALRPALAELRQALEQKPAAHLETEIVDTLALAPHVRHQVAPAFLPSQPLSLEERLAARQTKALAVAPDSDFVSVAFDLADLWLETGRHADVVTLMAPLAEADRRIYRGGQQPSTAHFYLGRALVLSDERAHGIAVLKMGLETAPGDAFLLAEIHALEDDPASGEQLERYYGAVDARWLTARALYAHGLFERAALAFASVRNLLPELRPALVGLAASAGRLGRLDEAMEALRAAHRLGLEPVMYADAIIDLAADWAAAHPGDPAVQAEAASILFQHGRLFDAHRLVLAIDVGAAPPPVGERIGMLRQRLEGALASWGHVADGPESDEGRGEDGGEDGDGGGP